MLTLAGAMLLAQVASEAPVPGDLPAQSLSGQALLLSAHLSALSNERSGWRMEQGLSAVGAGTAALAIGALAVHLTRADSEFLLGPAALGGGVISLGVVRLLVPTPEEELERKYHRAIARASEGDVFDVRHFEKELQALVAQESTGRMLLAGAYGLTGVAGVAASAYLASTNRMTSALLVSTASIAVFSMVGVAYSAYLLRYFEGPAERVWRQYVNSRSAFEDREIAAHNLSFGVAPCSSGSMLTLSGTF